MKNRNKVKILISFTIFLLFFCSCKSNEITVEKENYYMMIIDVAGVIVSAFASFVALAIAVFGRTVEDKLHRPKIKLSLYNESGELTCSDKEDARFYHIRVKNEGDRAAHNAVLKLFKVEKQNGDLTTTLWEAGSIPLCWKNATETETLYKNLGAKNEDYVDLICVTESFLHVCLKYVPNNFPPKDIPSLWVRENFDNLVLSVQLNYDEGISDFKRIKVQWDGEWEKGDNEMRKHLQIYEI